MRGFGLVIALIGLCASSAVAENAAPKELAGAASVQLRKPLRLNRPAANVKLMRLKDFHLGRSFFELPWVAAPSSTTGRDGLGPLFNVSTCRGCHVKGGKGNAPKASGPLIDSVVLRLAIEGLPDPRYGVQFQPRSIGFDGEAGLQFKGEGDAEISYSEVLETYPDGSTITLRKPRYGVHSLRYGELADGTKISARIGPSLVGLGLLEEIPQQDIEKNADPDDSNGDGISGRVHYVTDLRTKKKAVGRFGSKAQQPNILQQSAHAFRHDVGIRSSFFPEETCTKAQTDCLESAKASAGSLEIDEQILGAVAYHVRLFAVPVRRKVDKDSVQRGEHLFASAECTACHIPNFRTRADASVPEYSNLKVWPYTDLLLHDMGPGLADGVKDGEAEGAEWRTAPLWGVGISKRVNPETGFLHDGRARTLEEAILWHGGEAEASKQAFKRLSKDERDALIDFLKSL